MNIYEYTHIKKEVSLPHPVYPLHQIVVAHFSASSIPRTRTASSAAWEQTHWSVAHVNASWNMSKHAWVHEFA
jgi:hypothetical protein